MKNLSVEGLESRTLMSASTTGVFNRTVLADRLEVNAALLHFRGDALAGTAKLIMDTVAIKRSLVAGDTSLAASIAQLKSDNKALGTTLRIDRLNEASAALADQSVIKLELAQILKDKGDATALVTDRAALKADRVKLQDDLIAGINQRIADRVAAEATISTDTQAIVTAASNDPQATAGLMTAVNNFATDRTTKLATLTSDLATVSAARTQLATDLAAEANA